MTDLAREVRTGASAGFIGHGARVRASRAQAAPAWLRVAVVLGVSLTLWALIILSLRGLFAL